MIESLSIALHAFVSDVSMSFSVDETFIVIFYYHYHWVRLIDRVDRVFTKDPGDQGSLPCRIIPTYTKKDMNLCENANSLVQHLDLIIVFIAYDANYYTTINLLRRQVGKYIRLIKIGVDVGVMAKKRICFILPRAVELKPHNLIYPRHGIRFKT